MFAGYFGLAAAAKSQQRSTPLWVLMLSAYLLDFIFIILNLAGVESLGSDSSAGPYSSHIIGGVYSHSLVGALVIAIIAGLVTMRPYGRSAGVTIGGLVFAHWILDLLLYPAVLPVLPGGGAGLPLLGFGLINIQYLGVIVEAALVLVGAYLYFRAAMRLPAPSIRSSGEYRSKALMAALVTALLLIAALVTTALGLT